MKTAKKLWSKIEGAIMAYLLFLSAIGTGGAVNPVMAGEVKTIVGIVVALFVAGILLPIGVNQISNTSAYGQGVNPAIVTVSTLLVPLLAVVAIGLLFLRKVAGK